jgi:hypothetical protein
MLSTDAKVRNRQRDLRQFLDTFCPTLDKTRTKFFGHGLWAILLARSLIVARWLRWLPDRCKRLFYRHKRLLNQLHSAAWDPQQVLARYQRAWAKHIQVDTPLILDLTDLARPRARKLKYLALVRDGSDEDHRLVSGYWCIEVYAHWGKGRITPLLLHPYSIQDPAVLSENAEILRCVNQVMTATQGRGVLVMDIGADRDSLLIPWIDDHRQFVIRLRGDRHLQLASGIRLAAVDLAEHLLHDARGAKRAWCQVYLPERPDRPLSLVVKRLKGTDQPLMVLTTFLVTDLPSAKQVLSYYRGRWSCEEAVRFLKSQLGLERFALRRYESFGRLMLLAMLAMSFLTWLELHYAALSRWLAQQSPGHHSVKFAYYRLLDWFENQILSALPICHPP